MNSPRTTRWIKAIELATVAGALEDWLGKIKKAKEVASRLPNEQIASYNVGSIEKGMELLGGFVRKLDESRISAELGRPLEAGQLRPRSKKMKSGEVPTIASTKKIADKRRTAAKKKDSDST